MKRDRGAVECDEHVCGEHVAVDRGLADPYVVGVVAALDERRVLGQVEGVVARAREDASERRTGGLDAHSCGPADTYAHLTAARVPEA